MNSIICAANPDFKKLEQIKISHYEKLYKESIQSQEVFWDAIGHRIDWIKPYTKVKDVSFDEFDLHIKWYEDGTLNASVNCIDRHLPQMANETAIIFEADEPHNSKHITYQELHDHVCKYANILKARNIKKGDRVTIYMPMIQEAVYAMLACARIGAVHSVVFGGFSPDALSGRIIDCDSHVVITADEAIRGGKTIPLKLNVDEAIQKEGVDITTVLVISHTRNKVPMKENRDIWAHVEAKKYPSVCEPEEMNAEDPLFILYTSGSTGKPKGVLHTTGGYMVYASLTHELIFNYKKGDIYWCTADVGWVTGHSYIVYGPLANGATTVVFEGIPTYPDASRFWQVCQTHKVNIFYTAPTALRALMRAGDEHVKKYNLSSLRLLGTVGEPINPKAWHWYNEVVGQRKCPIVDTWWQTETGGIMISPIPDVTKLKPGSATHPFLGIEPQLVDDEGNILEGEAQGNLCIKNSWPGQMRTVYGDHQRFFDTYFSTFKGKYFTGDGCKRDKDGYYWITGRVDDVINVSGHRIGTAEVESALVLHEKVAEAAVVGFPHEIKGQGIYAYVTLMKGYEDTKELKEELKAWVKHEIGAVASPEHIHFAPALPKTRSGKIMRRILRKIANCEYEELGDISTLADPLVVDDIVKNQKNCKK
jgi:acetyl-CoA synthetase